MRPLFEQWIVHYDNFEGKYGASTEKSESIAETQQNETNRDQVDIFSCNTSGFF